MIYVVKWDGRKEPFNREKIIRTLLRLGASTDAAEQVVQRIEAEVYDGVTTKEILEKVFRGLEEFKPAIALRQDLREAIGRMRPAPDFEEYVRILLRSHGYRVSGNRVIRGFCVTHEIDGIAEKDGETTYLEVKHHRDPHVYTPFGVTLAAKAKWDDIRKGFEKGLNRISFDKVLIVCNTKLTRHAAKYAECIGLEHLGWNTPAGHGLGSLINERDLYPVTILKRLTPDERDLLADGGIITLKQLLTRDLQRLKIPKRRLRKITSEARRILEE
ncbi:restriction endonuclease [Candidatus Bathyarchaeota archaeon]|nr:MAG: restriction endonuclease [Candidatus Bathyarchaeota archaeon]